MDLKYGTPSYRNPNYDSNFEKLPVGRQSLKQRISPLKLPRASFSSWLNWACLEGSVKHDAICIVFIRL